MMINLQFFERCGINRSKVRSAFFKVKVIIMLLGACFGQLNAQSLTPDFINAGYTLFDLGSVGGVPVNYGGLTILPDQPDVMYLGGAANESNGAIYAIPLERDPVTNHIIGFGTAQHYVDAPNIDGGIIFTPESTLLFTQYPNNSIGQILPDDSYLSTPLDEFGVISSVGSSAIVPNGYPGAGNLILSSYNGSHIYNVPFSVSSSGQYSFSNSFNDISVSGIATGPEGIAYVPIGSQGFEVSSMLISAYDLGKVVAFEVGANGLPIPNTGKDLITGLNGAEGAVIDPVTGDFLFSTFGGGNRIILVSGFSTPTNVEKTPSTLEKLSLFPNPFKEVITLVAPSQVLGLKVQVQDANGLIVLETLQEKSNTIEMDLSKLPSGWFVIRVWSEDAVWVKKVLKQ
jgi:hypothetical protein